LTEWIHESKRGRIKRLQVANFSFKSQDESQIWKLTRIQMRFSQHTGATGRPSPWDGAGMIDGNGRPAAPPPDDKGGNPVPNENGAGGIIDAGVMLVLFDIFDMLMTVERPRNTSDTNKNEVDFNGSLNFQLLLRRRTVEDSIFCSRVFVDFSQQILCYAAKIQSLK
jgi:hypothetical protein